MDSADEAAAAISKAIQEVARRARSEEDLRIGIEEALAGVRKELGVLPRYERSYSGGSVSVFGGGSSDAVYGHAIIEYKRRGRLSKPRDLREATAQLKGYMYCEAEREGVNIEKGLRRIIGIGLDGQCIFFLRYRGKRAPKISPAALLPGTQLTLFDATAQPEGFQLLGPYPVSTETIAQFLLYLRALHRRPLTPEALAEEFGPRGDIAGDVVATLYNRYYTPDWLAEFIFDELGYDGNIDRRILDPAGVPARSSFSAFAVHWNTLKSISWQQGKQCAKSFLILLASI